MINRTVPYGYGFCLQQLYHFSLSVFFCLALFQMDPVQKAVINHTFGVPLVKTKRPIISCNVCQIRFNSEVHYLSSHSSWSLFGCSVWMFSLLTNSCGCGSYKNMNIMFESVIHLDEGCYAPACWNLI